MARKLRIQYPGAIYHVMNRGDRREPIFEDDEDRRRFEDLWGHPLPAWKGHRTLQMLEAAHRGEVDFLYSLGGNLLETMPERAYMSDALSRVGLRVHQDIVLNTSSRYCWRASSVSPVR